MAQATQPQIVYVLVVEHEYGTDCWAFDSKKAAQQQVRNYVKDWWEQLDRDDKFSDFSDPDEAVTCYFEEKDDEWYMIRPCPVEKASEE
jgi:hypothetical protein